MCLSLYVMLICRYDFFFYSRLSIARLHSCSLVHHHFICFLFGFNKITTFLFGVCLYARICVPDCCCSSFQIYLFIRNSFFVLLFSLSLMSLVFNVSSCVCCRCGRRCVFFFFFFFYTHKAFHRLFVSSSNKMLKCGSRISCSFLWTLIILSLHVYIERKKRNRKKIEQNIVVVVGYSQCVFSSSQFRWQ